MLCLLFFLRTSDLFNVGFAPSGERGLDSFRVCFTPSCRRDFARSSTRDCSVSLFFYIAGAPSCSGGFHFFGICFTPCGGSLSYLIRIVPTVLGHHGPYLWTIRFVSSFLTSFDLIDIRGSVVSTACFDSVSIFLSVFRTYGQKTQLALRVSLVKIRRRIFNFALRARFELIHCGMVRQMCVIRQAG